MTDEAPFTLCYDVGDFLQCQFKLKFYPVSAMSAKDCASSHFDFYSRKAGHVLVKLSLILQNEKVSCGFSDHYSEAMFSRVGACFVCNLKHESKHAKILKNSQMCYDEREALNTFVRPQGNTVCFVDQHYMKTLKKVD